MMATVSSRFASLPEGRWIERSVALFSGCDGEPDAEKNKQRTDGTVQQRGHRRAFSQAGTEHAGEPRQDQAPDGASGDKGQTENKECGGLGRRGRVDEL